jgi:hypothetical protein
MGIQQFGAAILPAVPDSRISQASDRKTIPLVADLIRPRGYSLPATLATKLATFSALRPVTTSEGITP